jgi:hypothetical protein
MSGEMVSTIRKLLKKFSSGSSYKKGCKKMKNRRH